VLSGTRLATGIEIFHPDGTFVANDSGTFTGTIGGRTGSPVFAGLSPVPRTLSQLACPVVRRASVPCEASGVVTLQAEPYTVRVSEETLADLRARIGNTRLPEAAPGAPWEQGTDLGYLRGLLAYWADGFDWRAQERWLNRFCQFRTEIDGARVHFVHERARSGRGIPLILTHGWPSCFAEFLPVVPWLTDPAALLP
jgi:hypothetical protein